MVDGSFPSPLCGDPVATGYHLLAVGASLRGVDEQLTFVGGQPPAVDTDLSLRTFFFVKDSPKGQPPETTNRQPLTRRQPPPTANHRSFMLLCHEAESVPVNIRFCWRCETSSPPPLRDSPELTVIPYSRAIAENKCIDRGRGPLPAV